MKKIIISGLVFSIFCLVLTSCKKSDVEPVKEATPPSFLTKYKVAIENVQAKFEQQASFNGGIPGSSNGVEFITPFFTTESWGIFSFSPVNGLTFLTFSAELGDNDFYRVNNDGTIAVHVNSNTAVADYISGLFTPNEVYLTGNRAHFDVNYSGAVVEDPFNPGFYYVDPFVALDRAISIHGNARIRNADGTGPWQNLTMKWSFTPGWGQVGSAVYSLH
jgi:hypothetical protein